MVARDRLGGICREQSAAGTVSPEVSFSSAYSLAEVMMFFRALTADEEVSFRTWARDNYQPGSVIDGAWHPSVQDECLRINRECAVFVADEETES